MITYKCNDCGEVFLTLEEDYVNKNPRGSDLAIDQALLHHRAHLCPYAAENDTVDLCPDCGEEIFRADCEYIYRNPIGSARARDRAQDEHQEFYCPIAATTATADQ